MTALPLRDFTDAERAKLDAIEAAPAAEESVTERVAVAMYEADQAWEDENDPDFHQPVEWRYNHAHRDEYRRRADAALAVLSGPSSDAERAVERVLALADYYAADSEPELSRTMAAIFRAVARDIRAAITGPSSNAERAVEVVADIRDDKGYYHGKVGTPAEHRTVGDYRAWCHDCGEWCYPAAPCGEPKCCTALTDGQPPC